MDLYYQETEVELLLRLFDLLDNKIVVDVGAEKGSFVDVFLNRGCAQIYAFEPYARHVEFLRERFGANPAVQIFPVALGSRDETTVLHIAQNQAGEDYEPYHT